MYTIKELRYNTEDKLDLFMEVIYDIPEFMEVPESKQIDIKDLQEVLEVSPNKSITPSTPILRDFLDDLSNHLGYVVSTRKIKSYFWFHFQEDTPFLGYFKDLNKIQKEKDKLRYKVKKDKEKVTIEDGTWGITNKDISCVYLLRSGEYCKIGKTKDMKARLSQIQTGNPTEVEVVCTYHPYHSWVNDRLERGLHSRLQGI